MHRVLSLVALVAVQAAGCAPIAPLLMRPELPGACRVDSLRWFAPQDAEHRSRLDAWCAGVGGPAIRPAHAEAGATPRTKPIDLDDIVFVSWNVHVGQGDVRALVDDLRSGTHTDGRTVSHFVLMLQEAMRTEGVPPHDPDASGAARIGGHDRATDIVQVSRDLGLSLIYVPSMRNGNNPEDPAADRGCAILSTLPLLQPVAIELPGERQRRVAILATIARPVAGTTPARLTVAVAHLDALGSPRRLWVFGTPGIRERQVRSMATLLPEGPLVLGADLNTWQGTGEPAAQLLGRLTAQTAVSVDRRARGLGVLDYLFFRTDDRRSARYRQAKEAYGSDHRPLIGWIE